jgi:hypothetical protein
MKSNKRSQLFLVFFILLTVAGWTGCKQNLNGLRASCSGRVMRGETPVANAKILMLPLGDKVADAKQPFAYATTNEQGRFTMRFEPGDYGAHVGRNMVLISTLEKKIQVPESQNPPEPSATEASAPVPSASEKDAVVEQIANSEGDAKSADEKKGITAPPAVNEIVVHPESIPRKYNRASELEYDVLATGNADVVFQVE